MAYCGSLVILLANPDVVLSGDDWVRLGLLFVQSALLLSLTFSLSATVSAFVCSPATSLIICLFGWLVAGVGYVNALPAIARYALPYPPCEEFVSQAEEVRAEFERKMEAWDTQNLPPAPAYRLIAVRERHGVLDHPQTGPLDDQAPLLAGLTAAPIQGWAATGERAARLRSAERHAGLHHRQLGRIRTAHSCGAQKAIMILPRICSPNSLACTASRWNQCGWSPDEMMYSDHGVVMSRYAQRSAAASFFSAAPYAPVPENEAAARAAASRGSVVLKVPVPNMISTCGRAARSWVTTA